jgi:hypothetical protein
MRLKSLVVTGLVAGSALFALGTANATPNLASGQLFSPAPIQDQLAEQAQYRPDRYNYCRHWRRECAARWGWGSFRWRICVRRHGCGGGY